MESVGQKNSLKGGRPPMLERKGLTLIELLVVISIIALLLALLRLPYSVPESRLEQSPVRPDCANGPIFVRRTPARTTASFSDGTSFLGRSFRGFTATTTADIILALTVTTGADCCCARPLRRPEITKHPRYKPIWSSATSRQHGRGF